MPTRNFYPGTRTPPTFCPTSLLQSLPLTFSHPSLSSSIYSSFAMANIHPESPEDFEFIETPAASCTTPAEDCGVRTTSVSSTIATSCLTPSFLRDSFEDQALKIINADASAAVLVSRDQKCSCPRRRSGQRQLLEHPTLLAALFDSMVFCSSGLWRILHHHLLCDIHYRSNLDGFLVDCLLHLSAQERKGQVRRPPRRILSALPQ